MYFHLLFQEAGRFNVLTRAVIAVAFFSVFIVPSADADFASEFNNATYFYKKSEYELAAKTFERLAQDYPTDPRVDVALYWAAESHHLLESHAEAQRLYKKLSADHPNSKFYLKAKLGAAQTGMNLREFRASSALYSELSHHPGADSNLTVLSRAGLAESLILQGDDRGAEGALLELLQTPKLPRPHRMDAEHRLRQVLIRLGRAPEIASILSGAAENTPQRRAEKLMAKADEEYRKGGYGQSAVIYEQIAGMEDIPPEYQSQAAYGQARSLIQLGAPDQAYEIFSKLSKSVYVLPGLLASSQMEMTYLYRDRRMSEAAIESAKAVEKIADEAKRPDLKNEALFFRAEESVRGKNYDGAQAILSQMTESGYRVNRLMGQIQLETGRHSDAAVYFDRAASQAPDDQTRNESLFDVARCNFDAKWYDAALTALSRLRQPSPELEGQMLRLRAQSYYELGRHKEASKEYAQLASVTSDRPSARLYRYYSVLSALRDKNPSWADRLLKELDAAGGIPQGPDDDPATFLDAAVQIDNAIEFAAPGKDELLQKQIDAQLSRLPAPAPTDTRSLRLHVFVMERLHAKDRHALLPKYTQSVLQQTPPEEDLYGRAAYYEVRAQEKAKNPSGALAALSVLEKWVALRPSSPLTEDAKYLRARFLKERGDDTPALRAFREYLETYPEGKYAVEAYYHLGLGALAGESLAEAERAFEKLATRGSGADVPEAVAQKARYYLGIIRIEQRRPADAVELLSPLSDIEPYRGDAEFRHKLAKSYLSLGRSREAEPHLRHVIQSAAAPVPIREEAALSLLTLLHQSKQHSRLAQEFAGVFAHIKSGASQSLAKYYMGMALFEGENHSKAAEYFDGVRDPSDAAHVKDARVRRADCDYHLGRYAESLDRYNRIVRDYPRSPWAQESLFSASLCKIKLGESGDALEGLESFLQKNPEATLASNAALSAAQLYIDRGDLDAAEEKLVFLEKHPSQTLSKQVTQTRMALYQKRGRHAEYLELAKEYLKAHGPDYGIALAVASTATSIGQEYDPFDLRSERDLGGVVKKIEGVLAALKQPFKTFSLDERFQAGRGQSLDFEEAYCTLKRVIFTDPRVYLVVEAKSVSFSGGGRAFKVKGATYAGEDLHKIPGAFCAGVRLNEDATISNERPLYFVLSVPGRMWADNATVCLDGIGFRRGWYCYSHSQSRGARGP